MDHLTIRTICPRTKCPVHSALMTPAQFRNLLEKTGLNLGQAAVFLEVTDRTLRRYLSGDTPIPKTVIWTILRYIELQKGSKS